MRRGHKRIKINSVQDFNDIASDMFHEFLEDFTQRQGLTREWDEDDPFDEDEVSWMYTQKGMRLIVTYIRRMKDLGEKYFDIEKIRVESALFIEP
jgi:hypothetical protein